MGFFGKNLQTKHKVTLCLVMLGILANAYMCNKQSGTFPFIGFDENGWIRLHVTQLIWTFGIFVKMLVLAFFRKF